MKVYRGAQSASHYNQLRDSQARLSKVFTSGELSITFNVESGMGVSNFAITLEEDDVVTFIDKLHEWFPEKAQEAMVRLTSDKPLMKSFQVYLTPRPYDHSTLAGDSANADWDPKTKSFTVVYDDALDTAAASVIGLRDIARYLCLHDDDHGILSKKFKDDEDSDTTAILKVLREAVAKGDITFTVLQDTPEAPPSVVDIDLDELLSE